MFKLSIPGFQLADCEVNYVGTDNNVVLVPKLKPRTEAGSKRMENSFSLSRKQALHLADALCNAAHNMECIGKPGALFRIKSHGKQRKH